jgi:hypothetical protein
MKERIIREADVDSIFSESTEYIAALMHRAKNELRRKMEEFSQ